MRNWLVRPTFGSCTCGDEVLLAMTEFFFPLRLLDLLHVFLTAHLIHQNSLTCELGEGVVISKLRCQLGAC